MPDDLKYQFGRFELDLLARELRAGQDPVALQPRVFDLLCYFAANASRAISREELLGEVWAGAAVTDASLTKAVRALRTSLRRDPLLRDAVRTVRGHGYRFDVPVEVLESHGSVVVPREVPDRLFVGREAELAKIAERARQVREGARRFVLIVGEPGTGKTALAHRALEAAAEGLLVGEGQCVEGFGAQAPYLPITEAIVSFARWNSSSHRFRIRTIVQRVAPSWRGLLPALFTDDKADPQRFELAPAEMARQLLDAIELVGGTSPAALFIEDLHWADQSTLSLLHSLASRSSRSRLLTICTARTSEIERSDRLRALRADVSRSATGLVIETTPMRIDSVRDVVSSSLRRREIDRGVSTDRFVDWLHAKTGGHPLFLSQLIDHLSSLGLLGPAQGETFAATRLDEAGIPETLGQLIRHWVAQLEPPDRAFLEAASVAGYSFDLRVVRSALGLEDTVADASCDRLCQGGWLQFRDFEAWVDGTRGARLRFEHVLYKEALYQGIPPSRRARLHHSIARRIESGRTGDSTMASELAAHYELAGSAEDAARHRVAAAAFAASTQSVDETLHHAALGLRCLPNLRTAERTTAEISLMMAIGMAHASRSGFGDDRAMEAFDRARDLAHAIGDHDREIAATWGVASCRKMRGEIESAREAGSRLLSLAELTEEPRHLALALDLLGSIAFFQGRFSDCLLLKQRIDGLVRDEVGGPLTSRSVEDVGVTAQMYGALAQWHQGDEMTALEWSRDAVVRAERLGHPYTIVFVEAFAAILHFLLGDAHSQRRHANRGRTVSEQNGIEFWGAINRFLEVCAEPSSEETLPTLRASLAEMARHGGLGGTFFIQVLADRELAEGNIEVARRLCQTGIERAVRTTESHHLPMLFVTAACVAIDDSELKRQLEKADASAARIDSIALQSRVARVRATACSPRT